jgi:hypothetical protein
MVVTLNSISQLPEFPLPFYISDGVGTGFPMRTLLEVKLDTLTHSIRTKPRWWEKISDESILSKWRSEAAALDVSGELFDFAVQVGSY